MCLYGFYSTSGLYDHNCSAEYIYPYTQDLQKIKVNRNRTKHILKRCGDGGSMGAGRVLTPSAATTALSTASS